MGLLKSIFSGSESERKEIIEFFKNISGIRVPKINHETLFDQVSFSEAKAIKLALEKYPELILSSLNKKDFEASLECEKIRVYRSNRPDYKPTKPKRDSSFVAGFKSGYGIGGSGDSSH